MLQRAASNAYSWWWAGHIRTKQSKWLEQSMQDMEEKVDRALGLIQEDGDTFAKRAEMYYKKRPELINFVEEAYRAFRALAERYDSLSTDLQKANTTIATCLPEQVQFAMMEEDDYLASRHPKFGNSQQGPPAPNLPKFLKDLNRPMKGMINDASKKLEVKKSSKADTKIKPAKSGLTKSEALEEIDKLQKDILALQTMKEYVKSSYESGISNYWGLENEIMEKQDKVSRLQDEFCVSTMIDDNDARTLMAESAIKSCRETLGQLQDKQEKTAEEAKVENAKIEDAHQRLKVLKDELLPDQADEGERADQRSEDRLEELQSIKNDTVGPEGKKLEALREKVREQFRAGNDGSLTVSELADKIDDIVNMVINLESSVLSQTVLIDRLKTEADDFQSQIRRLEDDKANLMNGTHDLQGRLKETEEKLYNVQNLNQNVVVQNTNLHTHFSEVHCSLDQLVDKLQSVQPDEELEETSPLQEEKGLIIESNTSKTEAEGDIIDQNNSEKVDKGDESEVSSSTLGKDDKENNPESSLSVLAIEKPKEEGTESIGKSKASQVSEKDEKERGMPETTERPLTVEQKNLENFEDELNWQKMLLDGLEDKERILLAEYTAILRNYKEVKKKLSDEEKKNETFFETALQLRDMKTAVAKKDQEIQSLRQKLKLLQQESDIVPEADDSAENEDFGMPTTEEDEEEIKFLINQPKTISPIEEKLRGKIDTILEENLNFWLRFSGAFHQVKKFKTEVQDLENEITQLQKMEEDKQDGKSHSYISTNLKADVRAVYKHLGEKKTELTAWLGQSESLKDELQRRNASITAIQEVITDSLREGVEAEEITFSTHQAAKFQGEVLNMKQENNKVNEELLAGIDHITALRIEIEKTLVKLNADFKLTETKSSFRSYSRPKIPLRSLLFGIKAKKHKHSIFSYMHQGSKKLS